MDEGYKQQIQMVKALGDRIGYGNMMCIASALWANDLEPRGMRSGAFVPTILQMMKKPYATRAEAERNARQKQFKEANL